MWNFCFPHVFVCTMCTATDYFNINFHRGHACQCLELVCVKGFPCIIVVSAMPPITRSQTLASLGLLSNMTPVLKQSELAGKSEKLLLVILCFVYYALFTTFNVF